MLLENNQLIKIESTAILADVLPKNITNRPKNYRLDIFKNEDGYTMLVTESELDGSKQLISLDQVQFAQTTSYEADSIEAFLKYRIAIKSQELIKHIHKNNPYFFSMASKKHEIDLAEPVAIIKSIPEQEEYFIVNGVDVISSLNEDCSIVGLSGSSLGCFINKDELIYMTDNVPIIIPTALLDLNHIQELNEFLEMDNRSINVGRIEKYLNRKIEFRKKSAGTKELPLIKGNSLSRHLVKAVIVGKQINLTIHAELLAAMTLNNRKYRLYHSGVGYLFTHSDDETDDLGYRQNYNSIEFEGLHVIHTQTFKELDKDIQVALLKILADHNVDGECFIAEKIPATAFVDKEIQKLVFKDDEGEEHTLQVTGKLLKEITMNGTQLNLYGTSKFAVIVAFKNELSWTKNSNLGELVYFIQTVLQDEVEDQELVQITKDFLEQLTKIGFVATTVI